MSVNVPIGKGIGKFPKIKRAQPDRESISTSPTSQAVGDIQLFRKLAIQGRFISTSGSNNNVGELLSTFTPPEGTTFFFLSATVSNPATNSGTVDIRTDGVVVDTITIAAADSQTSGIPMALLVGDGSKVFDIIITEATPVDMTSVMIGWTENTERVQAEFKQA